jgi:hypothetical protein
MGTQINKGTTYADGGSVTADNLNNHVDNATLAAGCITAQSSVSGLNQVDTFLMQQGGSLRQASVSQIKDSMSLGDYLKRDGSAGMTTGQLSLYTTTQISALDAVSLGHLNANFLKNTGSQTLVGSLGISNGTSSVASLTTSGLSLLTTNQVVALAGNPLNPLEVVPKQYVDNYSFKAKAMFSGRFANTTQAYSGSYTSTSTTSVSFTFSNTNPFLIGHKFSAACTATSGTAPVATIIFIVTNVAGLVVTATPHIAVAAASTGTFTIRGCLTLNSIGENPIKSIIYCGIAADTGLYAVNLTNTMDINLMAPSVTTSYAASDQNGIATTTAKGYTVIYDYIETGTIQITRQYPNDSTKTNSFVFGTYNSASYDTGYRSSVVVF